MTHCVCCTYRVAAKQRAKAVCSTRLVFECENPSATAVGGVLGRLQFYPLFSKHTLSTETNPRSTPPALPSYCPPWFLRPTSGPTGRIARAPALTDDGDVCAHQFACKRQFNYRPACSSTQHTRVRTRRRRVYTYTYTRVIHVYVPYTRAHWCVWPP